MSVLHRAGSSAGGPAWGAWVKLTTLESSEVLADAGFDFCVIDLEHTLMDLNQAYAHVVVASRSGMRVMVRIPDQAPSRIQRLLDAGAEAILAPHVDDAGAARGLVGATRFPPYGTRGSGATSRAGGWGRTARADYLTRPATAIAQIESVTAVEQLDQIAAVDGVAGIMLGAADLNLDPRRDALGSDEEVAAHVVAAAHERGILAGTASAPAAAQRQAELGFDFVVCANDSGLLATAAHDLVSTLHARSTTP